MTLLAIVISASSSFGGTVMLPQEEPAVLFVSSQELPAPYLLPGYRLLLGKSAEDYLRSEYMQWFYLRDREGRVNKIRSLAGLRGKVKVTTPEEALDFVRLQTSLLALGALTFGVLKGEILQRRDLSAKSFFNDEKIWNEKQIALIFGDGAYYTLTDRSFRILNLQPAKSVRSGAAFIVSRTLVFPKLEPLLVEDVIEKVEAAELTPFLRKSSEKVGCLKRFVGFGTSISSRQV